MLTEEENLDNKIEQSDELLTAQKAPLHEIKLWKRIYLFLAGLLGLHLFAFIIGIFVYLSFPKDLVNPVTNLITYSVLLVALVAVILFDLPKLLYHFKKWQAYAFGVVGGIAIVVFDITYTNILNLFYTYEPSGNEENVRDIIDLFPLASVLILGIVGPVCGELTYRVGLFALVKKYNKWLAYIITIIVFGAIHVVASIISGLSIWNELANLPMYLFAGFAFSFLYDKWGIGASLTAHIGNNLYAVIVQIIYKALVNNNA